VAFSKTERLRIRVTEDMLREIRATAELDERQIQDQARFLLSLGLQRRRALAGNGPVGETRAESGPAVPASSTSTARDPETARTQMSLPGTVGPVLSRTKVKKRGVA
jgi:hypothetical protein